MAVVSLVLGIIGLLISVFLNAVGWVGSLLGILGIIFGALGRKNAEKKGLATAGLTLSIIAVVLGILFYIACAACLGGLGLLS